PRPKAAGDDTDTWSSHVARSKDLLKTSNILPADADALERRLWQGLHDAIDSFTVLDALGRPVKTQRFFEGLGGKGSGLRLQLSPSDVAGVQVMDVMTARGLSFDAALLVGLNEKLFPRLIREDPFLSDAARSALSQALGCRLARKMDGYQEERLLFDLARDTAANHLCLTYQRSDEEGKALIPSLYLHEIPEAAKPRHLPRTFAEKWAKVPLERLTPKEISILLNREGADATPLYEALEYDRPLYASLLAAQNELESFKVPLGKRDGVTGPAPRLKELLAKGFSP